MLTANTVGRFVIVNTLLNTTDVTLIDQLNGRQGDNGREIFFWLKKGDLPFDISNKDIKITVKDAGGKVKQISGIKDVIKADAGQFSMIIPSEMYQAAGDIQEGYISVIDTDGTVVSSIPIMFNVLSNNIIITSNPSNDYIDTIEKVITEAKVKLANISDTLEMQQAAYDALKVSLTAIIQQINDKQVAILNGDNDFSGANTFAQPIKAGLATRLATFTDLADVAKDTFKYAGNWSISNVVIGNSPVSGQYTLDVEPGYDSQSGHLTIHDLGSNTELYASVDKGIIKAWKRVSGDLVATLIPAKADLNDYTVPGIYDSGENATTILNGITNPSTEIGHDFILTVTADAKGTTIQQDLKTYTGWAFTRTIYQGQATVWTAYSGTMNTTIEGPFKSAINLLRTGNYVIARIVNVTQGLAGGQQSDEIVPTDYIPVYVINKVPNMTEAIIRSYYEDRVLTVQSNGTVKNWGSEEFKGTGYGTWPIIG
ncbi:hypothetical protein WOSG25_270040 [Weissella oryzae SG25]|uniref:BppU N-terminal domain-containing protein n=1 Tax=Weissella oryzae (strain DSM 25784 / JCM 18191 / LMG 30913 / SG25) TaxID=1329250 RepID=A0A069CXS4_WEIOS|nr:BppU family phage baseplate upper protein [Weissella oryzae]GAK32058.1 hypothetical protein WOSG25_270040 [Weissella oryzae SG25]